MSLQYQLERINKSFEQIAIWYRDFMQRTDDCFVSMHNRQEQLEEQIARLERQSCHPPSDEQVERVLRKILAERFAEPKYEREESMNISKETPYFVQRPKQDLIYPKPILLDLASLQVDGKTTPSEKYEQDMAMLQGDLADYPHVN
ncbi:hypothetical protein B0J11DRAFT_417715, partial [Dendryphion nanum]